MSRTPIRRRGFAWTAVAAACVVGSVDAAESVRQREARRVEVVARASRPTIAIFEATGQNGGSGVVVSDDGYAVTNFHVVAPCGPRMTCGTNDGRVHDAVLVGLDPTGDIALIKLLGDGPFPAADIGDSDAVRVGDEAIVIGNPFLLAENFTPSVSIGVISGVNRYQPPAESLLEYADCLQTDAAINPGNSGGPLFDGEGRLIGINGRGSFEKRGRVNVGFGYAVSINQVMRFLPQLKSGRIVDHASLGATVRTARRAEGGVCLVDAVDTLGEAYRRGLRPGDELLAIDGRDVRSANELLNRIGVLPAGWRTEVVFRRFRGADPEVVRCELRLAALHRPGELRAAVAQQSPPPAPLPPPRRDGSAWRERYAPREGFANAYFSSVETRRVLGGWSRSFRRNPAAWSVALHEELNDDVINVRVDADGVSWDAPRGRFRLDAGRDLSAQPTPAGAPGLLAALWAWRAAAQRGAAAFDEAYYVGALPWVAGERPADVVRVARRGAVSELYFEQDSRRLIGVETSLDPTSDSVRVALSDHRSAADGGEAIEPHRWEVFVGAERFGVFRVDQSRSGDREATP